MKIHFLDIILTLDITETRFTEFFCNKLSHFVKLSAEKEFFMVQETSADSLKGADCRQFGESFVFFDSGKGFLRFYYSENDRNMLFELLLLQYLLYWLMRQGIYYLHGSCVMFTEPEEVVLFMGRPGAGKTSIALKSVQHGARLISDDFMLIRKEKEDFVTFRNGTPPHIFPENLESNFPNLKTSASPNITKCGKIDIQLEGLPADSSDEGWCFRPQMIVFINGTFGDRVKVAESDCRQLVRHIADSIAMVPGFSYKKYFQFAADLCDQCDVIAVDQLSGIDENYNELATYIRARCLDKKEGLV